MNASRALRFRDHARCQKFLDIWSRVTYIYQNLPWSVTSDKLLIIHTSKSLAARPVTGSRLPEKLLNRETREEL
jgi:hypothetical protein